MKIDELIGKQYDAIIEKWRQSIIDSYPRESGKFLLENQNKFSNPIGYTVQNSLKPILNAVQKLNFDETAKLAIDDLIRIRAVQDFSPSNAIGFISQLKAVIISEISTYINDSQSFIYYLQLERIFDELSSYSFDKYVLLREQVYIIKSNETKKGFERMIERLNKKYEDINSKN